MSLPRVVEHMEDLDESLMFDDGPRSPGQECSDDSSVDLEPAEPTSVVEDAAGADFGDSAKSSTLQVSLRQAREDEDGEEGDFVADLEPRGRRMVAHSLPAHQSQIRMGTSVPISIPMMGRWKKDESGELGAGVTGPVDAEADAAAFIPPHKLSQRDDFMFSFTGDSPGAALKRDRLRARNAILKSTGFLEKGVPLANTIGLQERNRLQLVGGLTQALQHTSKA